MTITVDGGARPVVHLDGEMDISNWRAMEDALDALDGASTITVDCARLTFLDSVGIGALVTSHVRYERTGQRLVLRSVHGIPHRALEVAGLLDVLNVEP